MLLLELLEATSLAWDPNRTAAAWVLAGSLQAWFFGLFERVDWKKRVFVLLVERRIGLSLVLQKKVTRSEQRASVNYLKSKRIDQQYFQKKTTCL